MFKMPSTPQSRTLTFVLLAIFCVSAEAAAVIGIGDNPPGISLAFGAFAALVLAVVHPWRSAKQYGLLLCAAILGLVVFGILHNVFEGVGGELESAHVIQIVLQSLGVGFFLLAVLICPPALVVGVVDSIVMLIRNRRRPTQDGETVADRRGGAI